MFYYIIKNTYKKIGDLFCPVYISGLSHSVSLSVKTEVHKNKNAPSEFFFPIVSDMKYVQQNRRRRPKREMRYCRLCRLQNEKKGRKMSGRVANG